MTEAINPDRAYRYPADKEDPSYTRAIQGQVDPDALAEYEEYGGRATGDADDGRFKDLPINEAPQELYQTQSGEVLGAQPIGSTYSPESVPDTVGSLLAAASRLQERLRGFETLEQESIHIVYNLTDVDDETANDLRLEVASIIEGFIEDLRSVYEEYTGMDGDDNLITGIPPEAISALYEDA